MTTDRGDGYVPPPRILAEHAPELNDNARQQLARVIQMIAWRNTRPALDDRGNRSRLAREATALAWLVRAAGFAELLDRHAPKPVERRELAR